VYFYRTKKTCNVLPSGRMLSQFVMVFALLPIFIREAPLSFKSLYSFHFIQPFSVQTLPSICEPALPKSALRIFASQTYAYLHANAKILHCATCAFYALQVRPNFDTRALHSYLIPFKRLALHCDRNEMLHSLLAKWLKAPLPKTTSLIFAYFVSYLFCLPFLRLL